MGCNAYAWCIAWLQMRTCAMHIYSVSPDGTEELQLDATSHTDCLAVLLVQGGKISINFLDHRRFWSR